VKVLFIARPHLYSVPGGDTVQIDFTAKYLRRLGVAVDVHLSPGRPNYSDYDLLHFFNLIDPEDLLGHAMHSKVPYVLSPIYVDYSEYDRKHRSDIVGLLGRIVSYNGVEYLKTLGKFFLRNEKISSLRYFLIGHKAAKSFVLNNAKCLLPNSPSELNRVRSDFGTSPTHFVIPNGIDHEIFPPLVRSHRAGVLCVARIEGRKNQLNIIRALNDDDFRVTLIGKSAPNQTGYWRKCKSSASENIRFSGHLPQDELRSLYASHKVHVLPSWFETTGLSTLEAAAMGCNVVVADKGDVRDYFGDHAYYCDPSDPLSIQKAVHEAYTSPQHTGLEEKIRKNFTWEIAAYKTLEAYNWVLNNRSTPKN
jgi:glycosyltransferase involved in cell wall biosynthesis